MIYNDNSHYNHSITTKWYCQWLPFPEQNHCTARSARSGPPGVGIDVRSCLGSRSEICRFRVSPHFLCVEIRSEMYRSQHMGIIQIIQPDHWGSLGISTYFNHRYILLTAMMMEYRDPSIGHKMAQVILKTSMISYDTSMIL